LQIEVRAWYVPNNCCIVFQDRLLISFFTEEKVFTVAAPSNHQNDRLYVARSVAKKQISADRLL